MSTCLTFPFLIWITSFHCHLFISANFYWDAHNAIRTYSRLSNFYQKYESLSSDSQQNLKLWCQNITWTSLFKSSLKAFLIIQILSTNECGILTKNWYVYILTSHTKHKVTQWFLIKKYYGRVSVHTCAVISTLIVYQVTFIQKKMIFKSS